MNVPQVVIMKPSVCLRRNDRPYGLLPPMAGVSFSAHWGCRCVKDVPPSSPLFCVRRILSPVGKLGCAAVLALSAAVFVSGLTSLLLAQTTIGTGSIVGTASDPSGAVISGAPVSIVNGLYFFRAKQAGTASGNDESRMSTSRKLTQSR
jgi:hypothetical protein